MRVFILSGAVEGVDSLRLILHGAGHVVQTAGTLREAYALAPSLRPEVLVGELYPAEDHSETWWRKLRTHAALAETRFIAVTARYDPATVRLGREAGFEYVLAKPVDVFSLDEYLVGVSSPRWRRHLPGPHPWPPRRGGDTGAAARAPDPSNGQGQPVTSTGDQTLIEFLRTMRELEAGQVRSQTRSFGPMDVPTEVLIQHLEAVSGALEAARAGDTIRGRCILNDALFAALAAPREPWSEAVCERYRLALRAYCALHASGANPE